MIIFSISSTAGGLTTFWQYVYVIHHNVNIYLRYIGSNIHKNSCDGNLLAEHVVSCAQNEVRTKHITFSWALKEFSSIVSK